MDGSRVIDDLGSAVSDESFPEVDLALRRGRHIDRDDTTWYAFLLDAQAVLETFYRRFGCELVHKSDGYFYLLPVTDQLGKRQLSVPEMLVGQALALLYLDPRTVQSGGVVTRDDVLTHLAGVMGTDGLMRAMNPKKRRLDERVAQEAVRARVAEGLRKLSVAGFIELGEGDSVRLRSALMRFAEPVRGSEAPEEALAKLVARGEVMLEPEFETDPDAETPFEAEADASSDDASSDDTGSDDTGSDDTGSDDTGSDDASSDDTGSDDTGSDDYTMPFDEHEHDDMPWDSVSEDAVNEDAVNEDAVSEDHAGGNHRAPREDDATHEEHE